MTKPEIRRASPDEAAAAELLHAALGGWIKEWNPDHVWVAVLPDGSIVATAREAEVGARGVHVVESVWVREDFRGRHLGICVIEQLLEQSKSPRLWLDCHPVLVNYYAKLGFKISDKAVITPDYMDETDPPDQIVMSISIMEKTDD